MRQVGRIMFNTPVGYDTADSDQDEKALVLFCGAMGFFSPDSEDEDQDADAEGTEDEDDDEDLSDRNFQIFPDEDSEEIDAELALQPAIWNHFQELQGYRNYLRELWEGRECAASSSPSLLVERHPSMKDVDYDSILQTALGGDKQVVSNLMKGEGGSMQVSLMIDTSAVCHLFLSMREEIIRTWAGFSHEVDRLGQTDAEKRLLMTQFCLWNVRGMSTQTVPAEALRPCSPLTIGAVLRFQLHQDALWFDRCTQHPMGRLLSIAYRMITSVRYWLDVHNPAYYGNQAAELERQMHDLSAYANTLYDDHYQAILERDPRSRGQQEWLLLQKSWEVGCPLIMANFRLVDVMSLYLRLRAYFYLPEIEPLEFLRRELVTSFGTNLHTPLGYRVKVRPIFYSSETVSLLTALKWAEQHQPMLAIWALDAFTIEQMALAVLEKLHRSCQWLLRPHMSDLEAMRAPDYVGLVECFFTACQDGTPRTVEKLTSRGRRALRRGLDISLSVNPRLTFVPSSE
ncbi:hypothetical protein DFH06DRAFT_570415 [Mycena polygramma]|nr:hypothetical protein DFH06DRAFT_570415 [Mycena polygramma]